MIDVFAQPARLRRRACQLFVSSALIVPGTAWADCTPAAAPSGSAVTCSGTSASYTNANLSLAVTADGTAVVTAPLVIGSGTAALATTLTVAKGGSIQGSTAVPSVQFGDYAQVTNNGTISSSSSTSGAAAIQVGINSTVTNNGTLTAVAGTPAVAFFALGNASTNGTFINGPTAPAAVTGDVALGYNSGASVGTVTNAFNTTTTATSTATYGINGNLSGHGNMTIDNEGQWTGVVSQVAFSNGQVKFTNGASANFTGAIVTGDITTVINNATGKNAAGVAYGMVLQNGTALGTNQGSSSSLINNGVLTIGSSTAPALVTINGSFTQSATGVLYTTIAATGTQNSSQIDAIGGTATLAGALNVSVLPGFFQVGAKYDLIKADLGITGNFGSVQVVNSSGALLPFITFRNDGIQPTTGTQRVYEFSVQRVGTYAQDIRNAGAGTPNQLAVATALQPLTVVANTTPTGQEAALIGQIDQLTIPQATVLFDQLSPAGLLSYATALRDEANNFERAINLRLGDQNSDHAEDGWWASVNGQVDVSKATSTSSKQKLIGFNLGYDLSGPHHVFGVAGTVTFDTLHNADSTLKGKNRDYAIAGYGGYDAGPIHLTGQVAYNFGHLSTTRTLTLGAGGTASGKASEHLFKATGTAGVMLHAAGYTFEPFGGIDFMRGKINGFTETGDGAAALTVLPINADRTDLLAGLSLTRATGKLRPYVRATYRAQIGNGGAKTVSAYFDGNTATAFTVAGVQASRHEEDINAGVNWVFEDAGSLFVGYQGTLRSGFKSHGINLGLRLEF